MGFAHRRTSPREIPSEVVRWWAKAHPTTVHATDRWVAGHHGARHSSLSALSAASQRSSPSRRPTASSRGTKTSRPTAAAVSDAASTAPARGVLRVADERAAFERHGVAQPLDGGVQRLGRPDQPAGQRQRRPFQATDPQREPGGQDAERRGEVQPGVMLRRHERPQPAGREDEAPQPGRPQESRDRRRFGRRPGRFVPAVAAVPVHRNPPAMLRRLLATFTTPRPPIVAAEAADGLSPQAAGQPDARRDGAPRLVIDTNVFVGAVAAPGSASGRLLAAVGEGRATLLVSPAVFREYRHVLDRAVRTDAGRSLVRGWIGRAEAVAAGHGERLVADDPDDDMFAALAIVGRADALVTQRPPPARVGRRHPRAGPAAVGVARAARGTPDAVTPSRRRWAPGAESLGRTLLRGRSKRDRGAGVSPALGADAPPGPSLRLGVQARRPHHDRLLNQRSYSLVVGHSAPAAPSGRLPAASGDGGNRPRPRTATIAYRWQRSVAYAVDDIDRRA